jgi:hypothetical protein
MPELVKNNVDQAVSFYVANSNVVRSMSSTPLGTNDKNACRLDQKEASKKCSKRIAILMLALQPEVLCLAQGVHHN